MQLTDNSKKDHQERKRKTYDSMVAQLKKHIVDDQDHVLVNNLFIHDMIEPWPWLIKPIIKHVKMKFIRKESTSR